MELISFCFLAMSPMAQRVENLPGMQEIREMWVQSLGWEDALEEGMAAYSGSRYLPPADSLVKKYKRERSYHLKGLQCHQGRAKFHLGRRRRKH